MVNKKIILLFMLFFVISSYTSMAVSELVFDKAGVFTGEEKLELNKKLYELSERFDMDILIVSVEDAGGKNSRDYADDYFDYEGFGRNQSFDGILFLIDLDNREIYISTSGRSIENLNDRDIENILDKVFDSGLIDGDYYGAASAFINQTNIILNRKLGKNTLTILEIFLSLSIGLAAASIFYIVVANRYKFKNARKLFDYQKNSIVNFKESKDQFINKFVSHRRIPKNNNTGGGSGTSTHRSSSGRTHGGGGRKF